MNAIDLANNVSTPPEMLRRLAQHVGPRVKRAVARNQSTPPDALDELSRSRYEDVLVEVADNPATPTAAVRRLSHSGNELVRSTATRQLLVRGNALDDLSLSDSQDDRLRAARNPATWPETLRRLSNDHDKSVAFAARWAMKERGV